MKTLSILSLAALLLVGCDEDDKDTGEDTTTDTGDTGTDTGDTADTGNIGDVVSMVVDNHMVVCSAEGQWLCPRVQLEGADWIVLPGSKHVRGDLQWLRENGWDDVIERHLRLGGKVIGICGGYQMLGRQIHDPDGVESAPGSSDGLGWLQQETTLQTNKTLRNVSGELSAAGLPVSGYEIHAGTTRGEEATGPLFALQCNEDGTRFDDGVINADGNVLGTYLHGLFDTPEMLAHWLQWSGLGALQPFDYPEFREAQIERLADEVERCLPLERLLSLLSMEARR